MDKILKQKFWILSGLVLPLALAGYFIANGALQADTDSKVAEIEAISAPNPNLPNNTHTEVAKALADQQERDNNQQLRELDAIQRRWFKWPKLILDGLEKNPDTGELVYRGENIPPQTLSRISVQYPDEYKNEMLRTWLTVNPVVPSDLPYSGKTKNKVLCPIEILPFHVLSDTPKIQDMWDAQEDVWLLEMLFTAINTTNQAATDVNESAIREIMYLELFGGSGESSVLASGTGGGDGGGEFTDMGAAVDSGADGGGAEGSSVVFADGAIAYDPATEYGPAAGAGDGAGGGQYTGEPDGGLFGDPAAGGGAAKPLRYIGFDKENPGPYRKRGFYLSLLIQEKKIPDFVVNLANLDPPIYAGRWGFGNSPYDDDGLLTAGRAAGTANFSGVGYEEPGGGGLGRIRRQPRTFAGAGGGSEYDLAGAGGGAGGRLFTSDDARFPPLSQVQLLEMHEYEQALQNKDLVQLEISGVITIFTPDVPPLTPEEAAEMEAESVDSPPATPASAGNPAAEALPEETPGSVEESSDPAVSTDESNPEAAAPENEASIEGDGSSTPN